MQVLCRIYCGCMNGQSRLAVMAISTDSDSSFVDISFEN
jgi:hypothetical protein